MKTPSFPLWLELAAAIFIALVLSNIATVAFVQIGGELRFKRFSTEVQTERIAGNASLLLQASEPLRHELPRALSAPGIDISMDTSPLVADSMARVQSIEAALQRQLAGVEIRAHAATDAERDSYRPSGPPPDFEKPPHGPEEHHRFGGLEPPDLLVSIHTPDGVWINIKASSGSPLPRIEHWPFIYALVTTLLALLLAAIFMGRRVAQPLQVLAEAARRLRRGETGETVPEKGPAPVREAARAFNAMSERVSTTLKTQQAMMAAVAHDLRTPIAVLRVRAEFVQDDETRTRLLEGVADMQKMTEAILSAMRMDGSGEPAQQVDMGALAESLCADMEEIGGDVHFIGAPGATCMCRATEIRRALGNLIDNAVRYGSRAEVSLERREGSVLIHVDDQGPGIPDAHMARVFEPFARLEESRSADTGGHGLGLSIARLIARGHGGEITLSNRKPRGLRATLSLPAS